MSYHIPFIVSDLLIALVVPIFESAILSHVERATKGALANFEGHLVKYRALAAHKGLSAFVSQKGMIFLE